MPPERSLPPKTPSLVAPSARIGHRCALVLSCVLVASCHPVRSTAADPALVAVNVDTSARIARISADSLGTNLGIWYDVTSPSLPRELARIHPRLLRWPGGSLSETYHWQSHTECDGAVSQPAYHPRSTFRHFMRDIVIPGHYDVALTVAYGTNAACTGGGDPREAAAWVAYARAHHEASRIRFWSVGNESFGGWETDLHARPHDAATYAAALSGPAGYYARMKAADPSARIGVVVSGGGYRGWDSYVLTHAPYDFVELHWYAADPGEESDAYLLHRAPAAFSKAIRTVRRELAAAGRPGTPILVGELNSVSSHPGKQTVSLVNGLFAGQVLAEGLRDGLAAQAWWFGVGGTQNCGNNDAPSLYGFQHWGSYDLVWADTEHAYNSCTGPARGPIVPDGTLSPSGIAFQLVADFARPGEYVLAATAGSPDIRVYAATDGAGYALLLFNLHAARPARIELALHRARAARYAASARTYGRAQYDLSRDHAWPGAAPRRIGVVGDTFALTLPPWSITLLRLAAEERTRAAVPRATPSQPHGS